MEKMKALLVLCLARLCTAADYVLFCTARPEHHSLSCGHDRNPKQW